MVSEITNMFIQKLFALPESSVGSQLCCSWFSADVSFKKEKQKQNLEVDFNKLLNGLSDSVLSVVRIGFNQA